MERPPAEVTVSGRHRGEYGRPDNDQDADGLRHRNLTGRRRRRPCPVKKP
jgi:hypothetical protein